LSENIQLIECAQIETKSMEIHSSSSDETEEKYPYSYESDDDETSLNATNSSGLCYYSKTNLNKLEVDQIVNGYLRPHFKGLRTKDIARGISLFHGFEEPKYCEFDIAWNSDSDDSDHDGHEQEEEIKTVTNMATDGVSRSDTTELREIDEMKLSSIKDEVVISIVPDIVSINEAIIVDEWFYRPDADDINKEFDEHYIAKSIAAFGTLPIIIENYMEDESVYIENMIFSFIGSIKV